MVQFLTTVVLKLLQWIAGFWCWKCSLVLEIILMESHVQPYCHWLWLF